jgi:hypothetical protein
MAAHMRAAVERACVGRLQSLVTRIVISLRRRIPSVTPGRRLLLAAAPLLAGVGCSGYAIFSVEVDADWDQFVIFTTLFAILADPGIMIVGDWLGIDMD